MPHVDQVTIAFPRMISRLISWKNCFEAWIQIDILLINSLDLSDIEYSIHLHFTFNYDILSVILQFYPSINVRN